MKKETVNHIEFLTRSENRIQILQHVEVSPGSLDDLHQELNIPKPTLSRNINGLKHKNWIEEDTTEGINRITPCGELVLEYILETMKKFEEARKIGIFCAQITDKSFPMDSQSLQQCEITIPEASSPYAAVNRLETLITNSPSVRWAGPILSPLTFEKLMDIISKDIELEIITLPQTTKNFEQDRPDELQSIVNKEATTILTSHNIPSFGICILPEKYIVVTFTDNYQPYAIIEIDMNQEALVDYLQNQLESCVESACEYKSDETITNSFNY